MVLLLIQKLIQWSLIMCLTIVNNILIIIFGDFYKNIIDKVIKLLSHETSHENLMNDTLLRLEMTEHKLTSLQNQMVCYHKEFLEFRHQVSHGVAPGAGPSVITKPMAATMGPMAANISKMSAEYLRKSNDSGLSSQILWHLLNTNPSVDSESTGKGQCDRPSHTTGH
ncbi:unnamed protein product [Oppiella nova]|uniref:Uncharacterized protein n=1 Tax=Oppiella nova TaxID=334625 RepID=A0A7R9M5X6_9ACAR|nr:unnamed protein product [Oppiella nova]CAG2170208.1 unnamed protein product [Oppiella nova]